MQVSSFYQWIFWYVFRSKEPITVTIFFFSPSNELPCNSYKIVLSHLVQNKHKNESIIENSIKHLIIAIELIKSTSTDTHSSILIEKNTNNYKEVHKKYMKTSLISF